MTYKKWKELKVFHVSLYLQNLQYSFQNNYIYLPFYTFLICIETLKRYKIFPLINASPSKYLTYNLWNVINAAAFKRGEKTKTKNTILKRSRT